MRVALISDIHANAVALDAALSHLRQDGVDEVVCLGDVAQGGAQPAEAVDRLRALGCRVVMGNADAFLVDPDASREPVTERHLAVREWTLERLGEERVEFLRTFEPTVEAELAPGRSVLCFHGSPTSYDDVLLPSLSDAELRGLLGEQAADVLAGGHVHLQWLHRLGDAVFLNPGSVGLSYDHEQPEDDFRFDPWAAYGIVDAGETLEISFRRVPFDATAVVSAIADSGIPDGDELAQRWLPRAE